MADVNVSYRICGTGFGAGTFGWFPFGGSWCVTTTTPIPPAGGGAGGAWRRRVPPKLMTPEEATRLVFGGDKGILVHETDLEAEEIDVLRLLGLL